MSSHPTAPKLAFWLRAKPRCYSGLQSSEGPVPCFPWPQPLVTMLLAHGHPAVLQTQQALPRFRPFTCDALSPHTCIAHFSLPLGIFPPNVPSNETFPHHPTEAHTCTDTCKNADTQMHTLWVVSISLCKWLVSTHRKQAQLYRIGRKHRNLRIQHRPRESK